MIELLRVVFNCNTLLQALASPDGPAGRCVQSVIQNRVQLFISPTVISELRDVATRPRVAAKLRISPQRLGEYCEVLERTATILQDFPLPFAYDRDPDDAHYVNLALAAKAVFLVTRDKDLLDLMDASRPESAPFLSQYRAIKIITPVGLINHLDATSLAD